MNSSPEKQKRSCPPEQFVFILGIHRRSGTNYLCRLLEAHPDCRGIGPIGEDFLIHNLDMLDQYVENVKNWWNPDWLRHTLDGERETFHGYLGGALLNLLYDQSEKNHPKSMRGGHESSENASPRCIVSKTPSVRGVSRVSSYFPQAKLLLLARDGRAVVESGMRSFGWSFEKATRQWAAGASALVEMQRASDPSDTVMFLKYENIVRNGRQELEDVFEFIGLDPQRFDFEAIENMGVIGSSDLALQGGEVHWEALPQTEAFDPLKRFETWTPRRHRRFNWIAGREMERLGYTLEKVSGTGPLEKGLHRLRDFGWFLKELLLAVWQFLRSVPAKIGRLGYRN